MITGCQTEKVTEKERKMMEYEVAAVYGAAVDEGGSEAAAVPLSTKTMRRKRTTMMMKKQRKTRDAAH